MVDDRAFSNWYAIEKIEMAVHILATTDADLKVRIFKAACECMALQERDFPPDLVPLWQDIQRRLTTRQVPGSKNGVIQDTLATMRRPKAVQIAELFCELASQLRSVMWTKEVRHKR